MYRQCQMVHSDGRIDVSWIPARFAVVGKALKIHGENGWSVVNVYARCSAKDVLSAERDYLRQRPVSDI